MLGAGGVLTELWRDSVSLLPPFTANGIEAALMRLTVGRLLGGYFSQLVVKHPKGPTLFGISPERFGNTPLHIHWALIHAGGAVEYGLYVAAGDFKKAKLDPLHPPAAMLVKMGKVKRASDVKFVFANLNNWDATMWLIPNPAGQFEDKNPTVKPSANQGKFPSERRT